MIPNSSLDRITYILPDIARAEASSIVGVMGASASASSLAPMDSEHRHQRCLASA